ncbi:MAG: molybdenum cofactor guanylyltransferase, partial [Chloroflexota bacterium]
MGFAPSSFLPETGPGGLRAGEQSLWSQEGERQVVTGIVLCGGKGRRLKQDKALLQIGGQSLVERVVRRLSVVCSPILVVVADRDQQARLSALLPDTKVLADLRPGKGALGGVYTGLSVASTKWGMVLACDMPFVSSDLLEYMISQRHSYDAIAPRARGLPEPLHALYSRSCLPTMEGLLDQDRLQVQRLFDSVNTRYVTEVEMATID